jgi:tRNA (uracil-5-)-methyltransferase
MECNYFGICGGCNLVDMSYDEQLDFKIQREKDRFKDIYLDDIDVIRSDDGGFRNRAEFRIFHKMGKIYYAMNSIDKKLLPIQKCSIVDKNISNIMDRFLKQIELNDALTKKFFAVEFLSGLNGDMLITMIYHKKLDTIWIEEAKKLKDILKVKIIGRSRKQKVVLSEDYIEQKLNIDDKEYRFYYKEGGFTQPNQKVNIQMIQWVGKNIIKGRDLCELYCGGGNFTISLSRYFNKVLATEISKTSIKSAKINCELNNIDNIKFIRLSSEEFVEAKQKIREFRRLKQENIELDDYDFSTIFVDPPRAGLDETTRKLCQEFDQIIYISCNPQTLYRDLKELIKTHNIKNFALFDQFAFSYHIECGIILEKIV